MGLRSTAYAVDNSHIHDLSFCISNLLMIFPSLSSFRVQPLSSRHAYEGWRTLPTDKINLKYLCNDYECCYFCLFAIFLSRYIDIFSLSFVAENYGEYLTASVIIGDAASLMWRLLGLFYEYDPKSSQLVWVKKYVHERHTPTGCPIYDFFMGTILYPRIGNVDFKMIAEARWSWITLAVTTYSCAVKQYENLGYVSPQMALMVLAHWLYSNATVKGERCITPIWDMICYMRSLVGR